MDHEDGVIRVDHEHNLEKPAPGPRTPHQILRIVLDEWKWRPSPADDILSVLRRDAVPVHMFFIPFVPSKLHESSTTARSLLYKKLEPYGAGMRGEGMGGEERRKDGAETRGRGA
jgi:hypothetical protein